MPIPFLLLALASPLAQPAAAAATAGARPISAAYDGNCQSPAWSPNGARLAYEVNYHQRKVVELYVYSPGAGEPRKVQPVSRGASSLTTAFSSGDNETIAHEASWGPAFIDRFVYSATNASRDQDLYIDQASAIASAPGTDGGGAWSPDGRWIAFTSARTGQGDLYLLDAHQIDQAPRQLTSDPTSSELFATWSPDGQHLAYVGHGDNGDGLWLIDDLQTPKPRLLVPWHRTQTRPSWSPDGKQIAFYSNHTSADRFDLYVADTTGASTLLIAEGVVMNAHGPSWTPDSKNVVYVLDDDADFDPIWSTVATDPSQRHKIDSGTVGNGDLDVVLGTDGKDWLAVAAQGRVTDDVRDFKRIYVMQLN